MTAPLLSGTRPEPRYAVIERSLREAITSGRLPPGTVLTEGPIAALFGTSRTPVRTALSELMELGLLSRFAGRGFLVAGGETPLRTRVTPDILGLEAEPPLAPPPVTSQRIARDFENALARALPFGMWRIHEQAAAAHYNVSRTVVRELLQRFQDRGLVHKDLRSHWVIGPLTSRDIANYFAIRGKLEPLALSESAPRLPPAEIETLRNRVTHALSGDGRLSPEHIDGLELDLHVHLLRRSPNPHLLRMIHQSQIALAVNRVFASEVGSRPFEVALREHTIVFEFLARRAWDAASNALEEHLKLSRERTRQRFMSISVFPEPELPDYLRRQEA